MIPVLDFLFVFFMPEVPDHELDRESAISKIYCPISMKIETNLLKVLLDHFSKFPGEDFFWIFGEI